MIVYISVGNSDDKLSQAQWADFIETFDEGVTFYANHVHGVWFSQSASRWQNAAWCLEFDTEADMKSAKQAAIEIRRDHGQQSAAWAVAETEFI